MVEERAIVEPHAKANNECVSYSEKNPEPSTQEQVAHHSYPDGGLRAWMVVIGTMCGCFATFGFINSWGIFQAYYQQKLLRESSPSNIAWIGSFQYSLIFFPALVFGRLFDLGYFYSVLSLSSIILVMSTFLIAQCTRYWHFLLCQGLAIGVASSGVVVMMPTIVIQWFHRKRGLALGFLAAGSSAGGTVIPIATKKLIPLVGFKWTVRIIGFILIFLLLISNVALKRKSPPENISGGLFNISAFRNLPYSLYCISGFITYLGFYTVLTYISVMSIKEGISEDFSFYLVAISNAGSLCGRYASGVLADRVGPLNVIIPFNILTAIFTFIWPYSNNFSYLIATAVIYGFFSGGYACLITHPLAELGGFKDLGRRTGMFFSIVSLGALAGPPISGVIIAHAGFQAVGWYAGSMILVGAGIQITIRLLAAGLTGRRI